MFEIVKRKLLPPEESPEPLARFELDRTELSHAYDTFLPASIALRESIVKGEFSTTHKIVLVEKDAPDTQLGYAVLEHLYSNALWWAYMKDHELKDLWVDRRDLTSLVQHRGIGTALCNISHKIIKPGEHRAIIDTSKGWTKRKIHEAQKEGIFHILEVDNALNYGKNYKRYLVKYN